MSQEVQLGSLHEIYSSTLKEQRKFRVLLPKGYEKSTKTKYPVVYVLDSEINFNVFGSIYHHLSREPRGTLSEAIIVGIVNTHRMLNFTPTKSQKEMVNEKGEKIYLFQDSGGSDDFLAFLNTELKKEINTKYRTNGYSILVGHSFGGLLAFDDLIKNQSFNAYIVNDPSLWWDNQWMVKQILESKKDFSNIKLFLSKADHVADTSSLVDNKGEVYQKLTQEIKNGKLYHIDFEYRFYKNYHHGIISLPANIEALQFIFQSHPLDFKGALKEASLVETHFKAFSKVMHYDFIPTESLLDTFINHSKGKNHDLFLKMKNHYYK